MAFDFATLPKIRTHANLGFLGDTNQDAVALLEDAHSVVISMATAASDLYNDAVANGAPQEVIDALQSSYNDARQLVTDHVAIMNAFYASTGVSGLSGLSKGRLGSLGQWQALALVLGAALRQIAWGALWTYIASVVGRIADAFKSNTDAAQASLKVSGDYYILWKQCHEQGTECPPPPPNLNKGGDMTTYLLIGASALVAIMLLMKK
jgi:hypothetical protein